MGQLNNFLCKLKKDGYNKEECSKIFKLVIESLPVNRYDKKKGEWIQERDYNKEELMRSELKKIDLMRIKNDIL